MKLLKVLLVSAIALCIFTSCSQEPGEYSSTKASCYNKTDIPIDMAWQKAMEALGNRWEIPENDTVDKELTVQVFYHDVDVEFEEITANTTKYTVSSRGWNCLGNESAIQCVYLELERAFKKLED
jgi:hypothetical protein